VIESDSRLAPYRLVGDPAALERDGLFVAEGRLVVERLLEDERLRVQSVLVTPPAAAALAEVFARHPDVPVHLCAPDVLRGVTGFNFHRGCLALAHRAEHRLALSDVVPGARLLALEGVRDPDNVGGLFRTALALGVDAIVIDHATADPFYRKAIRTSMAATLRVPFVRVDRWHAGLVDLRTAGFRIIALSPHASGVTLDEYSTRAADRVVLLAGSEGSGLSGLSLDIADVRVRIPVDPRADSLNVVTAAAIALHALAPRVT
jgi:tRNA G18 (ribose-2'-O)-methylase SpoU